MHFIFQKSALLNFTLLSFPSKSKKSFIPITAKTLTASLNHIPPNAIRGIKIASANTALITLFIFLNLGKKILISIINLINKIFKL